MAQSNDPTGYDYVSPDELLQQESDEYNKQIGNSRSAWDYNTTVANRGAQIANGGGPAVQQAQRTQQRLKQIMQNVDASSPEDEDALKKSLRTALAISSGMADINPGMALQANQQALKAQQAITQQRSLNARSDYETSLGQLEQTKADAAKIGARYQIYDSGKDKDGLPSYKPYGEAISLYKPDGSIDTDFATKVSQAMDQAKKDGAQNPSYQTVDAFENGKGSVADMRNRTVLEAAEKKAAAKAAASTFGDPAVLRPAVAEVLMNPSLLRSIPQDSRAPLLAYMTAHDLSPFDGIPAQAEAKALNAAATAVGRRDGVTAFLSGSVPKLGDNVIEALDGVDRTRFPIINAGIIAGKNTVGDPGERKYAASIQSFVNEYARVISGGGAITSDAARNEAHALLSKSDSPAAIKATVEFLKTKELDAVKTAAPAALELINNPNRYPHITKLSQALGYDGLASFGVTPGAPAEEKTPQKADKPDPLGIR